jgi:SRSO17 transposase
MSEATELPAPELDLLDVQVWNLYWGEIARRITPLFSRSDAATQAIQYLAGLLSPAERKNSWQLAEISGASNPYGFQHLLGRALWNADDLRDHLRCILSIIAGALGDRPIKVW